jgi:hypothetical protein
MGKDKRPQVQVFRRDSGISSIEHELVKKAVADFHGQEVVEHIDQVIITDFTSDSPSFAGKVAIILFDRALEFTDIYGRNAGDSEYERVDLIEKKFKIN